MSWKYPYYPQFRFHLKVPGILLFAMVVTMGCGGKTGNQEPSKLVPYPTVKVEKRSVEDAISYPASLEGIVNSAVRAKVSGYIQEVLVDEGEWVEQGQLLFRLETLSLSQEAEAAKARVRVLEVEVDKLKPLVEQEIISPVQLETARANLAQARSSYQGLIANIGYAQIRSPVKGVVGTVAFRQGNLVSSQDPVPLTTVSSIDKVYGYFSMNEKDFIGFLKENGGVSQNKSIPTLPPVTLELADGSVYEHRGTIETISGSVDPKSGTVRFRATFANPDGLLRNGGSGAIRLAKKYENVLVVPTVSTFEQQGKSFIYLVTNDSVHAKSIEVLAETNGLTVLEGLEVGDQILAKGIGKVRPGTKIAPQPTSIDSIVQSFDQVFQ